MLVVTRAQGRPARHRWHRRVPVPESAKGVEKKGYPTQDGPARRRRRCTGVEGRRGCCFLAIGEPENGLGADEWWSTMPVSCAERRRRGNG